MNKDANIDAVFVLCVTLLQQLVDTDASVVQQAALQTEATATAANELNIQ